MDTVRHASPAAPSVQAFLARWIGLREVHLGYDRLSGQLIWVLLSRRSYPSWLGRYVRLCGEVRDDPDHRSVSDPQFGKVE